MKLAAAHALADTIKNPTKDNILPNPFDKNIVKLVSKAVSDAWNLENF
jgi:malic enzyme